jgi:hypothetical protein
MRLHVNLHYLVNDQDGEHYQYGGTVLQSLRLES